MDMDYRELVEKSGPTTLRTRREGRELTFARKCASSVRFGHWFLPRENVKENWVSPKHEEKYARTHRCYNSPLFNIKRRLNRG